MKSLNSIAAMIADASTKECKPGAFTVEELIEQDPVKRKGSFWRRVTLKMVKEGKWEKTWRQVGTRHVPAYIKIK